MAEVADGTLVAGRYRIKHRIGSGGMADVSVHRFCLATLDVPIVAAQDCEACKRGIPATKPGSRVTAQ